MVDVSSRQAAEVITRELLALRLFAAFLAADEAGYRFTAGELRALRAVSSWGTERMKKAAEYYESVV